MITFLRYIGIIAVTVVASIISVAYAQDQTTSTQVQTGETALIIADVNLTDISFAEAEGKITGKFALQGNLGQQNDIIYGVIVYNNQGSPVDATLLGDIGSVRQGEVLQKQFSYTVPIYLSGKGLMFVLVAQTKNGTPLGSKVLIKKDIVRPSSLTCSETKDTQEITCTSTVSASLTVVYHKYNPLGEVVSSETKEIGKGSTITFTPPVIAGKYYAYITTKDATSQANILLVRKGSFGVIQNIVVAEKSPNVISVITTAQSVPHVGTKLRIKLSQNNILCGQTEVDMSTGFSSINLDTTCASGTVDATLVDKSGAILATKTERFEVTTYYNATSTDGSSSSTKLPYTKAYIYAFIAVLLLIIYIILMKLSTRMAGGLAVVLLGVFLHIIPAHALTVRLTAFVPPLLDEFGSNAVSCTYTANTDKSSYAAGDSMLISASTQCDSGTEITSWNAGISMNGGAGSPSFDTGTFGSSQTLSFFNDPAGAPIIPYGFDAKTVTVTIPSSISSGSHYLAVRSSILGTGYSTIKSNISLTSPSSVANLTFSTVSAPAPVPTVQIWFSQ